jgi:hypothetical protein
MGSASHDQTDSNMPPELLAPAPRKVLLTENGRTFKAVITLLVGLTFILCLWYCGAAVQKLWNRSALRQNGVEVQGVITELHRAGRGPDVVHFRFAVNSIYFSGMSDVPPRLMSRLEGSSVIPIRYLPSNPNKNHPAAWEWSFRSEWLVIFILLAACFAWGATYTPFHRERKIVAFGRPSLGTVTNCRTNGRGSIKVQYSFRTDTGSVVCGCSSSKSLRKIGDSVWVLYMPKNPKLSLVYPGDSFYIDID